MNTDLFTTSTRPVNTTNNAGGEAYAFDPKHELAQYAMTGTFSNAAYSSAQEQLTNLMDNVLPQIESEFVAKAAVYARTKGYMKDVPAVLCAWLAKHDLDNLKKVFPRVIDNGKMLRNFAQTIRSGVTGRKSFGHAPRRLVRNYLTGRTPEQLLRDSVGNKPSLGDIIKMVHPKAVNPAQNAMFSYLIDKPYDMEHLPMRVRDYIRWKNGEDVSFNSVSWAPFQLLTSKELGTEEWAAIIREGGWHMTRMNLNTAQRHGVFESHPELIDVVAERLSDKDIIAKARVFPYQLLAAYMNADEQVPAPIRQALESAVDSSLANIPDVDGGVAILPDVSGSMSWSVTGDRPGASSKVRCIDVAALVASAFHHKAGDRCTVVPFDTSVHTVKWDSESVLENAQTLANYGGGGTYCALALQHLNETNHTGNLVVYVSDNESWVRPEGEERSYWYNDAGTSVMQEWNTYKSRNPNAKLVCIDIQPYGSTQAHDREDILNIGGFSDNTFEVISRFASGNYEPENFVGEIELVDLDG
tara:strand:- start:58566 stop:60149 length:1584 start_codon:yes stop_codon:yes gene_type:complete